MRTEFKIRTILTQKKIRTSNVHHRGPNQIRPHKRKEKIQKKNEQQEVRPTLPLRRAALALHLLALGLSALYLYTRRHIRTSRYRDRLARRQLYILYRRGRYRNTGSLTRRDLQVLYRGGRDGYIRARDGNHLLVSPGQSA